MELLYWGYNGSFITYDFDVKWLKKYDAKQFYERLGRDGVIGARAYKDGFIWNPTCLVHTKFITREQFLRYVMCGSLKIEVADGLVVYYENRLKEFVLVDLAWVNAEDVAGGIAPMGTDAVRFFDGRYGVRAAHGGAVVYWEFARVSRGRGWNVDADVVDITEVLV